MSRTVYRKDCHASIWTRPIAFDTRLGHNIQSATRKARCAHKRQHPDTRHDRTDATLRVIVTREYLLQLGPVRAPVRAPARRRRAACAPATQTKHYVKLCTTTCTCEPTEAIYNCMKYFRTKGFLVTPLTAKMRSKQKSKMAAK